MSSPTMSYNDATRLREIQRLLERIQQLPHVAGVPGNGLANGFHDYPRGSSAEPGASHDLIAPSLDPRVPLLLDAPDREHARQDLPRALVAVPQPQSSVAVGIAPWMFVVATAVNTVIAAVLAVVITLGVARREQPPAETEKVAARLSSLAPSPEPRSELLPPRPVILQPIGSPSEPLRLEALKPQRL